MKRNLISRREVVKGVAAASLLFGTGGRATADVWPSRNIRLISPLAGTSDIHARIIAEMLTERLGQKVVLDTKPGGAGIIGMQVGAKAPADGYNFTFVIASYMSTYPFMYKALPYDVERDFAPVAMLPKAGFLFIVREGLGVKSLADLTAHIKANPGKLTVVNFAPGSFAHLSFESYLRTFGGKAEMVPYRTEAPALQDLWGGRVDLHLSPIIVAPQVLAEGKARAIAITTLERHPLFPDVPTLDEQGVKGFDFYGWYGVVAPKNTPQAAINALNRELAAISETPAYRERVIKLGAVPAAPASPNSFARSISTSRHEWDL
jgi:tripartite-type tricarboxylate transporter receptor subunit TctC